MPNLQIDFELVSLVYKPVVVLLAGGDAILGFVVVVHRPEDIVNNVAGDFDESALSFRWTNLDPAIEHLYAVVRDLVSDGEEKEIGRREIFSDIWQAAHDSIGLQCPSLTFEKAHPTQAHMSEAWYCCAEPTDLQLARM